MPAISELDAELGVNDIFRVSDKALKIETPPYNGDIHDGALFYRGLFLDYIPHRDVLEELASGR